MKPQYFIEKMGDRGTNYLSPGAGHIMSVGVMTDMGSFELEIRRDGEEIQLTGGGPLVMFTRASNIVRLEIDPKWRGNRREVEEAPDVQVTIVKVTDTLHDLCAQARTARLKADRIAIESGIRDCIRLLQKVS